MSILIKTCGLKTPEIVAHSVKSGAHQIGFIFFEKSPRHVTPEQAKLAAEPARRTFGQKGADIVAVAVNANDDYLDEIVSILSPDMLQLHGKESPERVEAVKSRYNLPIMKAFSISNADDIARIEPYIDIADRMLLDAKAPEGSDLPGGNGVSFDWSLLQKLDANVDYMLSGGLNADNVIDAIKRTNCMGVDLSSGIESAPGVKSIAKIDAFFASIQQAA